MWGNHPFHNNTKIFLTPVPPFRFPVVLYDKTFGEMSATEHSGITELLARKAVGDISAEEEASLEQWLESSQANRRIYERLAGGQSLNDFMRLSGGVDDRRTIAAVDAKLRRQIRRRFAVGASSAAAVLLIGVFLFMHNTPVRAPHPPSENIAAVLTLADGREIALRSDDRGDAWRRHVGMPEGTDPLRHTASNMIKLSVGRGASYRIELPDGSAVWLNEESELEYPDRFDAGARRVRLSGEAFFDVAADTERPFEVALAEGINVSVLGTRFNIDDYRDTRRLAVTLVEGSVEVSGYEHTFTLAPNQQATFERETRAAEVKEVEDAAAYAIWIHGMFDFDKQPLSAVLDAVAEWYDIQIIYRRSDVRGFDEVTIHTERDGDYTNILNIIARMTGLGYSVTDGRIYIEAAE
jgi:ferric-dicitrate binding protein FerR (iron transport regulator)